MNEMLKGIKVVELASILAGPAVGAFFSELGARVIKFENRKTNGDTTRNWRVKGENPDSEFSSYYASVNIGKERRMINLSDPFDHDQVIRELQDADIVLVNFREKDAKKHKLDYSSLHKLNPGLIYGLVKGFPDSDRPAFDVVLQAESGLMHINGTPDQPPVKLPVAFIDQFAAHQLKTGILLALLEKNKSGIGALVTVNLYDAALSSLANQASAYLMTGNVPQRIGSLHPNIAPYGETLKTKDNKFVVLASGTDRHFSGLCKVLNLDLYQEDSFQTNHSRVINRDEMGKYLKEAILKWNAADLAAELEKLDVPFGIVRDPGEVLSSKKSEELIRTEKVNGEVLRAIKTNVFKLKWS